MLSNLFVIQGKLYETDFREEDLRRFHAVYEMEDVAKSIIEGARSLRASGFAIFEIVPKEFLPHV